MNAPTRGRTDQIEPPELDLAGPGGDDDSPRVVTTDQGTTDESPAGDDVETGIGDAVCVNADESACDPLAPALPLTPAPAQVGVVEGAPTEAVAIVPSSPPELALTGAHDPLTALVGVLLVVGGVLAVLSARRATRSNVRLDLTAESMHVRGEA